MQKKWLDVLPKARNTMAQELIYKVRVTWTMYSTTLMVRWNDGAWLLIFLACQHNIYLACWCNVKKPRWRIVLIKKEHCFVYATNNCLFVSHKLHSNQYITTNLSQVTIVRIPTIHQTQVKAVQYTLSRAIALPRVLQVSERPSATTSQSLTWLSIHDYIFRNPRMYMRMYQVYRGLHGYPWTTSYQFLHLHFHFQFNS